ncbi:hypothetical protein UFOVP536_57 [uncultured Caudovirales phage]|uniref:Uncharacterized protein n=1 Tax=uncultured Caudovirales phage TaxID=2100421 RepID=A0A6J5MQ24_9CAUD|nr:hypothetical protein UFOVP536_57 [uncultured Caudovirales phage]
MNTFKKLTTLVEVAEFCKNNVEDLVGYIADNNEDSEYFSGVQSAYIQVYWEITGVWLKATEPGEVQTAYDNREDAE